MHIYKKFIWSVALLYGHQLCVTSIVYNMQIAEITQKRSFLKGDKSHNTFAATVFGQWQQLYDGSSQSAFARLATYLYTQPHFYCKIDGAIGRVRHDLGTIVIKRTQPDDLLFTGGYGHDIGKHGHITYSALLGLPTHRDTFLDLAQFGTGHVGTGLQIDSSYTYTHNQRNTILAAVRFVHFYPRTITSKNPCISPSYACSAYRYALGNTLDLYISHQTNWNTVNRIEVGYNPSFAGFNAKINPDAPNSGATELYIHQIFFGAYVRSLPTHIKSALVIGFSGSFDSRPKDFGSRSVFRTWFVYGIFF